MSKGQSVHAKKKAIYWNWMATLKWRADDNDNDNENENDNNNNNDKRCDITTSKVNLALLFKSIINNNNEINNKNNENCNWKQRT